MISRLTAVAAVFAVLATSTIAWAASSEFTRRAELCEMPVIQLPTVHVVMKRTAASAPAVAQH